MTTLSCDVVVVGAGPTGLTLANILGAAGVSTVLVERNATTVQEPRAVSIDDESLRTMQAIGLLDDVLRDVVLDCGYHYFGPSGACFLKVEPATREFGFPRRNAFRQPLLEATLRQGLDRFANVATLFGHSCEQVTENEDGVAVDLRSGGGQVKTIHARYVAGCDGAKSGIRRAIGASMTGSTYEQRWLIVDLAATKEQGRHSRVLCDPARPAITLPGPHGVRRYEFMLHDDEPDNIAESDVFVRDLLAAHGPDSDAPIVRCHTYTFHARIADRWQTVRLFLAGDAAHLSPPFAGQGMNSGLRDAHNLGWKLGAVASGRLGADLLRTYEQERLPHASALIQMAVNIGRVMMPASHVQAALMRFGFRMTAGVPAVQEYFAQMKYKPKPFYEIGFLVPEGVPRLVGRMLPQPVLELRSKASVRLDDAIGPGFALVAAGAGADQIAAVAAQVEWGIAPLPRVAIVPPSCARSEAVAFAGVSGRDVDGRLGNGRDHDLLILLRPDRYVAGAIDRPERGRIASFAASVRELVDSTWSRAAPQSETTSVGAG